MACLTEVYFLTLLEAETQPTKVSGCCILRYLSLTCRWSPSPFVFMWSFLSLCCLTLIYYFYKDTSLIGWRPTLSTLLISKYSQILRCCGLRLQHINFVGTHSAHSNHYAEFHIEYKDEMNKDLLSGSFQSGRRIIVLYKSPTSKPGYPINATEFSLCNTNYWCLSCINTFSILLLESKFTLLSTIIKTLIH